MKTRKGVVPDVNPAKAQYRKHLITENVKFDPSRCAEYKIIEKIAADLPKDAKGEVNIRVNKKPCESCESVINAFKKDYPNMKVRVIYNE